MFVYTLVGDLHIYTSVVNYILGDVYFFQWKNSYFEVYKCKVNNYNN